MNKLFKSELAKARTMNNMWVLVVLAVALGLYKYSVPLMRLFSHKQEIGDLGAEVLQPIVVAMVYVCFGLSFSALMATFVEPQLREDSFGTWSRFGVTFLLCFLGFCWVAGSIL